MQDEYSVRGGKPVVRGGVEVGYQLDVGAAWLMVAVRRGDGFGVRGDVREAADHGPLLAAMREARQGSVVALGRDRRNGLTGVAIDGRWFEIDAWRVTFRLPSGAEKGRRRKEQPAQP